MSYQNTNTFFYQAMYIFGMPQPLHKIYYIDKSMLVSTVKSYPHVVPLAITQLRSIELIIL